MRESRGDRREPVVFSFQGAVFSSGAGVGTTESAEGTERGLCLFGGPRKALKGRKLLMLWAGVVEGGTPTLLCERRSLLGVAVAGGLGALGFCFPLAGFFVFWARCLTRFLRSQMIMRLLIFC